MYFLRLRMVAVNNHNQQGNANQEGLGNQEDNEPIGFIDDALNEDFEKNVDAFMEKFEKG